MDWAGLGSIETPRTHQPESGVELSYGSPTPSFTKSSILYFKSRGGERPGSARSSPPTPSESNVFASALSSRSSRGQISGFVPPLALGEMEEDIEPAESLTENFSSPVEAWKATPTPDISSAPMYAPVSRRAPHFWPVLKPPSSSTAPRSEETVVLKGVPISLASKPHASDRSDSFQVDAPISEGSQRCSLGIPLPVQISHRKHASIVHLPLTFQVDPQGNAIVPKRSLRKTPSSSSPPSSDARGNSMLAQGTRSTVSVDSRLMPSSPARILPFSVEDSSYPALKDQTSFSAAPVANIPSSVAAGPVNSPDLPLLPNPFIHLAASLGLPQIARSADPTPPATPEGAARAGEYHWAKWGREQARLWAEEGRVTGLEEEEQEKIWEVLVRMSEGMGRREAGEVVSDEMAGSTKVGGMAHDQ